MVKDVSITGNVLLIEDYHQSIRLELQITAVIKDQKPKSRIKNHAFPKGKRNQYRSKRLRCMKGGWSRKKTSMNKRQKDNPRSTPNRQLRKKGSDSKHFLKKDSEYHHSKNQVTQGSSQGHVWWRCAHQALGHAWLPDNDIAVTRIHLQLVLCLDAAADADIQDKKREHRRESEQRAIRRRRPM